jgi:hypothetical protein
MVGERNNLSFSLPLGCLGIHSKSRYEFPFYFGFLVSIFFFFYTSISIVNRLSDALVIPVLRRRKKVKVVIVYPPFSIQLIFF